MKLACFCCCGCGAVKTFEGPDKNEPVVAPSDPANNGNSDLVDSSVSPEALILAFRHLPNPELCGLVTAVSKTWQAAASAVLSSRSINFDGLQPGKRAASAAGWLHRYSWHIKELHIHRAEISPEEWVAVLSLPYAQLTRLEVARSRLSHADIGLLSRLTSLQDLTLNSIGTQLNSSLVQSLSSSLTGLSSLALKSCGVNGKHLQGLTPLIACNLCSLDLFDNPAIGSDVESSNKALQMWAAAVALGVAGSTQKQPALPGSTVASSAVAATEDPVPQAATISVKLAADAAGTKAAAPELTAADKEEQPAAAITADHVTVVVSCSSNATKQQQVLKQQQLVRPVKPALRQLQLSYCNIKHLPQLSQLTSLTSLSLQENKCTKETVEAIGQLHQLQHLVLEDAVCPTISAAGYAALGNLTNLEVLDISGGPAGCLEMLLGGLADPIPAPPKDKASTNGWHGLRVKWSGKGRPPAGFRSHMRRSTGSSAQSSPRATSESVPNFSCRPAAEEFAAAAEASGCKTAEGPGATVTTVQSTHNSPNMPIPSTPLRANHGGTAPNSRVTCGGISVTVFDEDICSPLPRLRRLQAEQIGLADAHMSSIALCCTQLQELDVSHNHIGTDGIAQLQQLTSLTHLNISAQQPSLVDSAAAVLLQLTQLKGLDVGGNQFSRANEVQLHRELKSAGGSRLERLTGCGMRCDVWEHLEVSKTQHTDSKASSFGSQLSTASTERMKSNLHSVTLQHKGSPVSTPRAHAGDFRSQTLQQNSSASPVGSPRAQADKLKSKMLQSDSRGGPRAQQRVLGH